MIESRMAAAASEPLVDLDRRPVRLFSRLIDLILFRAIRHADGSVLRMRFPAPHRISMEARLNR